jgi:hypothetical protein
MGIFCIVQTTNTVVVWAVVSFLGLLDPQSLEKAKAVTEITKKIP